MRCSKLRYYSDLELASTSKKSVKTSFSMCPALNLTKKEGKKMSFIPLLQAAQPAGQGNMLMSVVPFILIIAIFYFFIIRPQNKKQKETEKMINALKKGDKIVTIGGIHGTVTSTKEKTVIVKVDSNAQIEFSRSAISAVIAGTDKSASSKKAKKEAKAEAPAAEKPVEEPAKAENAAESVSETPAEKTEEKTAEAENK